MLRFHEELLEVEWPYAQVRVLAADHAELVIDRDRGDCLVICLVGLLQLLLSVINLENSTMSASNKKALWSFDVEACRSSEAELEVERSENGIAGVMLQND